MDQEKIGRFIASCRKKHNLTQDRLAEKLGITYKAVSKWETGKGLPDASIMIDLCNILDISVNDLLSGEVISKVNYMNKAEENLIELKEMSERNNKRLLLLEVVMIIICLLSFIVMMFASFYVTSVGLKYILIGSATFILLFTLIFAFIIEKEAGYYECGKCHHKYKPTTKQILFSTHIGWTRKLRCPICNEKSWNKKVMSK